jgi:transposase-like protein
VRRREGLLALSVGVGLGVLHELMTEEVEEVCGPRGKWDPDRVAYRHGTDDGEVTLGGRRVAVKRPRMRTKDGTAEVPPASYEHFASRDALSAAVMERMLAGVSTRRYRRVGEPVGQEVEMRARSTSKSSVSRTFVARTREALAELMSRRLDDVRLAVLMLDGIDLKGRTNVVALGITTGGVKIPLGLWEGSSENKTVATALLSDLIDRGVDVEQGVLVVIDGARALRAAVRAVLATAPRSTGAFVTRRGTSSSTCPSATVPPSSGGCGARAHATITGTLWTSFGHSPRSSPHRFARASRRRSPTPASASRVRSSARSRARTPASR